MILGVTLGMALHVACGGEQANRGAEGPLDATVISARDAKAGGKSVTDGRPASVSFCGRLKDSVGDAAPLVNVLVCNKSCVVATTSEDGSFCIEDVWEMGDLKFHAEGAKTPQKHYGDLLFPVVVTAADISQGVKKDLGEIIIPLINETKTVAVTSGGTLQFANGTSLTIPAGSITLPPLQKDMKTVSIAMVSVPLAKVHPLLLQGKPQAIYALLPATISFSQAASFSLPAPSGAAEGTRLEIFLANQKTGKMERHLDGRVSKGKIVNEAQQGLKALSWIAIYAK
jgi:hypothetical protein